MGPALSPVEYDQACQKQDYQDSRIFRIFLFIFYPANSFLSEAELTELENGQNYKQHSGNSKIQQILLQTIFSTLPKRKSLHFPYKTKTEATRAAI